SAISPPPISLGIDLLGPELCRRCFGGLRGNSCPWPISGRRAAASSLPRPERQAGHDQRQREGVQDSNSNGSRHSSHEVVARPDHRGGGLMRLRGSAALLAFCVIAVLAVGRTGAAAPTRLIVVQNGDANTLDPFNDGINVGL